MLGYGEGFTFAAATALYATAYRPTQRTERNEIDLWREQLEIGHSLPTLPLAVRGLGCLPIDLEATYMEARQRCRMGYDHTNPKRERGVSAIGKLSPR